MVRTIAGSTRNVWDKGSASRKIPEEELEGGGILEEETMVYWMDALERSVVEVENREPW